jgi:hypothetical protein
MDFRHYDAALGRFNVIDPMAEERDWLTPYNFVQNNPILRVDPTGLLDTYGLQEDGSITKIDKKSHYENGVEVDKVVDVSNKENSITIKKGSISGEYSNTNKNGTTTGVVVNDKESSQKLFEFASEARSDDKTGVEFAQVEGTNEDGTYTSVVAKGENKGVDTVGIVFDFIKKGMGVDAANHSHPGPDVFKNPSGLYTNGKVNNKLINQKRGDIYSARVVKRATDKRSLKTPAMKVYHPKTKTYTSFNGNGLK